MNTRPDRKAGRGRAAQGCRSRQARRPSRLAHPAGPPSSLDLPTPRGDRHGRWRRRSPGLTFLDLDPQGCRIVPGPLAVTVINRRISYTHSDRPIRHTSVVTVEELGDRTRARLARSRAGPAQPVRARRRHSGGSDSSRFAGPLAPERHRPSGAHRRRPDEEVPGLVGFSSFVSLFRR
jgi:hypothetical protein